MHLVSYRECLEKAAFFLKLGDVEAALKSGTEQSLDERGKGELEKLLGCLDFTLSDIAADYIPLIKKETLMPKENRIYFRELEREITHIVTVKQKGVKARFRLLGDSLMLPQNAETEVTYAYKPLKAALDGSSEWEGGIPGSKTVALGIASEYCLLEGMTDDALVFDRRFKDAIDSRRPDRTDKRMPPRRWL